jgi:hypothetical protein
MSNLRDMVSHRLQPLRYFYDGAHLTCTAVPDSAQSALMTEGFIPAGRCMHLDRTKKPGALQVSKLGCNGGKKIPVWIFRDSDAYSGGFPGHDVTTVNHVTWADGSFGNLLHFVGVEGYELATSEFDTTRTYYVGDWLRAPEADTPLDATNLNDVAGIVTNNTVRLGRECVVGIVSPNEWAPFQLTAGSPAHQLDPNGTKMLSFYTTYRPPLENVDETIVTA